MRGKIQPKSTVQDAHISGRGVLPNNCSNGKGWSWLTNAHPAKDGSPRQLFTA